MSLRIEDYAMIGNTHTVALVGNNGSIDWLCVPRFDSGACFAAMLGNSANGHWQIAPNATVQTVRRRYSGATLILENEFVTESGAVVVIDFMPVARSAQRTDIVRIVRGLRGTVPMRMDLTVRFDYGHIAPWITQYDYGMRAIAGPDALELKTPVPIQVRNLASVGEFTIASGQTIPFALTWYPSHEAPPSGEDSGQLLRETEASWLEWSSRCTLAGSWRDLALRSLITLKALTYGPTGGDCRSSDGRAAGMDRRSAQLGLPLLLAS